MKKSAKHKQRMLLNTRRSVVIIAMIAVLVLVINMITASYSWFTPESEEKIGMQYSFSGKVRSENCAMNTFKGTKQTTNENDTYINQIIYDTSATTGSVTVNAGKTQYFKTEIINSDTKNASDISLYISSFPACTLAVTYPANTVRKFTETQSDLYIVRDAYVKRKDNADVNGPGKLEIEWFVTNSSTAAITVNLNNLYLLYN